MLEWLKPSVLAPLQEHVVNLDVCINCHTKSLQQTYENSEIRFLQCAYCRLVYCMPAVPTGGTDA